MYEPRPTNPTPGDNAPFTPELKARFCEVLAEKGAITAACRAVGKHRDTIYEHLRTDPAFAAACDAARFQARPRLADRLMEDSIEGSADYLYRDGVLVGERRYTDNRLAYAMLRRLDKLAEQQAESTARGRKFDPKLALRALRTGSEGDLAAALATIESDTSDDPPFQDNSGGPVGFEFPHRPRLGGTPGRVVDQFRTARRLHRRGARPLERRGIRPRVQ